MNSCLDASTHFRTALASVLLLFIFLSTGYSQEGGTFYDYLGNIGDSAVGFSFIGPSDYSDSLIGKPLNGTYFFTHQLKDYEFTGFSRMDRSIHLFQRDRNGNVVAHFSGVFTETDPKGKMQGPTGDAIITGRWYLAKDTVGLPVYLQMEDIVNRSPNGQRYAGIGAANDSVFEAKVRYFRNAVLDGHKIAVSKCIDYPIVANVNGKAVKIRTASALLRDYDKIFHPKFIKAIRSTVPHDMFNNYNGAMLGDGIVWFWGSGKVIVINN